MLCCVAISDAAQNQDIVAVITELKFNRGDIGVVNPGKTTAEKPAVLQSLYAGSRIQATGDASAVILFTDGMRTVKIDEKNSPFEVKPTAKGASGSGRLKEVSNLLLSKKTSPSLVGLTVRGKTRGPTLLTPRETKLLTATPRFQWMGSEGQPSTVKVFGPEGIIWSAENIAVTQAEYPASANDLRPGGQYSWSVERRSAAPEKASFMILSSADARAVQEVLAAIGGSDGLSKTTLAILRSSFLISRELYYDARETLLEAARADPEEPTLHFCWVRFTKKPASKVSLRKNKAKRNC
jgi:hypothetical protein